MNGRSAGDDGLSGADERFERRARALLIESADGLPASVRSRLNQARQAALATRPSWSRRLARHWMPAGAGALAAAALVMLVIAVPHRTDTPTEGTSVAAPMDDLEMLADTDAVQLGRDDEVDYDFYEWAVGEATSGASAPSAGT